MTVVFLCTHEHKRSPEHQHNEIPLSTRHSVSLTQSKSRTLTKQKIKFLDSKWRVYVGHVESHCEAELDSNDKHKRNNSFILETSLEYRNNYRWPVINLNKFKYINVILYP